MLGVELDVAPHSRGGRLHLMPPAFRLEAIGDLANDYWHNLCASIWCAYEPGFEVALENEDLGRADSIWSKAAVHFLIDATQGLNYCDRGVVRGDPLSLRSREVITPSQTSSISRAMQNACPDTRDSLATFVTVSTLLLRRGLCLGMPMAPGLFRNAWQTLARSLKDYTGERGGKPASKYANGRAFGL